MNRLWIVWLALFALCAVQAACGSTNNSPADAGDADGVVSDGADGADGDGVADTDGVEEADQGPVELKVSAVLPSRGPVQGGTWVSIMGAGFIRGVGESAFDARDVTRVYFGDNSALDIEVVRDDMLSVRTPPGPAGRVKVRVENPNGRAEITEAFEYYDVVFVDNFGPRHLPAVGGTRFTLEGANLVGENLLLLGNRACAGLTVEGGTRIDCWTPALAPGPADLELVNRNGRMKFYHALQIHPRPVLESVYPPAAPAAGGTTVQIRGSALEKDCNVWFGEKMASSVFVDESLLQADVPPGEAGPVDVEVRCPAESARLERAFFYLDQPQGRLRLQAVIPAFGIAGESNKVFLVGEGFSSGLDDAAFAGFSASAISVVDDRLAQVVLPELEAGEYDVTVRRGAESDILLAAYRMLEKLQLEKISPAEGPATGGTEVTLEGEGFSPQVEIYFGGVPVTSWEMLSARQLKVRTPPGSEGVVPVVVKDRWRRAELAAGFQYRSPLGIVRVEPDSGAQAGGTFVTIYGRGLRPGVRVWFGSSEGKVIEVLHAAALTARTPRGEPGEVAVRAEVGDEDFSLPGGFSYFDPTNDRGGASGGPLVGSFNLTALDSAWSRYGEPVAGARVVIEEPALTGFTDDRGQITFSGPALVKPVTVTVSKPEYETITVANLNAANLTVYLIPNVSEPVEIKPGEVKLSDVSGRVFGFKDVPWLEKPAGSKMLARVNLTSYSIYGVPPYGGEPQGQAVETDGGSYRFTLRLGNYSFYALYGAYEEESSIFTPALLGLRRSVTVMSEEPLGGQDIILSTPLDQSVPVYLVEPPVGGGEKPVQYGVYASLDLGNDGVIYLDGTKGESSQLMLRHLPQAAADSFLFVALASEGGGYPLSYVLKRQEGSLYPSVNIGPFLGFVRILEPQNNGVWQSGKIEWEALGPEPDLCQMVIFTNEIVSSVLWRVVMPGNKHQVQLPAEVFESLPRAEPLILVVYTADSPRFEFGRFNYGQLSSSRWTAYTVGLANFTLY